MLSSATSPCCGIIVINQFDVSAIIYRSTTTIFWSILSWGKNISLPNLLLLRKRAKISWKKCKTLWLWELELLALQHPQDFISTLPLFLFIYMHILHYFIYLYLFLSLVWFFKSYFFLSKTLEGLNSCLLTMQIFCRLGIRSLVLESSHSLRDHWICLYSIDKCLEGIRCCWPWWFPLATT